MQTEISELFILLRLPLYRYFLAGTGSAADAEELTQDCFLRLYRYLSQGGQVDNPKLWLFHVAHNLLLDRHKRARRLREVGVPAWDQFAETCGDSSPSPEEALLQRERYEHMNRAMRKLTIQQREVLILKAEGLGYREIGEIMSLSTFAVAAHVRRAIAKMKVRQNGQQ